MKHLFFISIFLNTLLYAQPTLQWQKCYGSNGIEDPQSLIKTPENGFVIAGRSYDNGGDVSGHHSPGQGDDFWVVKTDSLRNIIWQKPLGGSGFDIASFIMHTSNGHYLIVGRTNSSDTNITGYHPTIVGIPTDDIWVVMLDTAGTIIWEKAYGGSKSEQGYAAIEMNNGDFIIVGSAQSNEGDILVNKGNSDGLVMRISSTGTLIWEKTFGGSGIDTYFNIKKNIDYSLFLTGMTSSNDQDVTGNHSTNNYSDAWITKIDTNGNMLWNKCYGGSLTDIARSIIEYAPQKFLFCGHTYSTDGDVVGQHTGSSMNVYDGWIVKIDSSGTLLQQKCFGGSGQETFTSIHQLPSDDVVLTGSANSSDGDVVGLHQSLTSFPTADVWIVNTDTALNLKWQKCLGGSGSEVATSMIIENDSNYVFCSNTYSNDGDVNGNHSQTSFYSSDYWLVKLGTKDTVISTTILENEETEPTIMNVFPNPFSETCYIFINDKNRSEAVLYNTLGERLKKYVIYNGSLQIERERLVGGIYLLQIINSNNKISYTKLLIK